MDKCCVTGCNQPADGLDDEHCQIHWEDYCSAGFFRFLKAADQYGLSHLLEGEYDA